MSFLFGGAPKMSSAEKIAAAETEVEMISDMFNRYVEAPRDIQALYLDSETRRLQKPHSNSSSNYPYPKVILTCSRRES